MDKLKQVEAQHRDLQRVNALYKHDLKEAQRKAEFEADLKRKLEEKVKELIHRLDSDNDLKEESTKLNRKLHNIEKEVTAYFDCDVKTVTKSGLNSLMLRISLLCV